MSETAQKLLEQIRALPDEDRRWMAGQMWETDEPATVSPPIPDRPMTAFAHELWDRVTAAIPGDRQVIADELLPEIDTGPDIMDDPEFRAELERRLEQVEKHPEQLLDGEEVMAELRRRYGG